MHKDGYRAWNAGDYDWSTYDERSNILNADGNTLCRAAGLSDESIKEALDYLKANELLVFSYDPLHDNYAFQFGWPSLCEIADFARQFEQAKVRCAEQKQHDRIIEEERRGTVLADREKHPDRYCRATTKSGEGCLSRAIGVYELCNAHRNR